MMHKNSLQKLKTKKNINKTNKITSKRNIFLSLIVYYIQKRCGDCKICCWSFSALFKIYLCSPKNYSTKTNFIAIKIDVQIKACCIMYDKIYVVKIAF